MHGTTIPSKRRPVSNGNEGVLWTPNASRIQPSLLDAVLCQMQDIFREKTALKLSKGNSQGIPRHAHREVYPIYQL